MKFTELLRRFRLTYNVYNFFQRDKLAHNLGAYRRYGLRKRYFDTVSSKDFAGKDGETPWLDAGNAHELLPTHPDFQKLPERHRTPLLHWSDKGYAILPGFFDTDRVDKANDIIQKLLDDGTIAWKYGNKLMFAIHHSDHLRGFGEDPTLLSILDMLLGRDVRLFQSINFYHGSEQKTHSDSIHMTTFPLGYMIACWVALEDIGPDQGPLHYYPGSHKLPYLLNESYQNEGNSWLIGDKRYTEYEHALAAYIAGQQLRKETFHARKGDVLIWHANLLHGGDPHHNKDLTRKSMVFHYYAKNVVSYHEISQRPALITEK
jgi:hypothetical protein